MKEEQIYDFMQLEGWTRPRYVHRAAFQARRTCRSLQRCGGLQDAMTCSAHSCRFYCTQVGMQTGARVTSTCIAYAVRLRGRLRRCATARWTKPGTKSQNV